MKKTCLLVVIGIILVQISSCSFNKVAEYDQQSTGKIIDVYRMINLFYLNMEDYDASERQYSNFSEEYQKRI